MKIYLSILIITALVGLMLKDRFSLFHWFVIFSSISEVVLNYMQVLGVKNFSIINIFTIITVSFYMYVFLGGLNKSKPSKKTFLMIPIYVVICLLNYFFYQGKDTINTLTYNLGMIAVIVLIIRYFYHFLFDESELNSIFAIPQFWLAIGLFIFYASVFPILTFINTLLKYDREVFYQLYRLLRYGNIFLSLSYLMFLLCPYLTKTSSTTSR